MFKANCAIQHQVFTWENLNISLAAQVADFLTREPLLLRDKQSAAVLVQEIEVMPDLSQTTIESLTTSSCVHVLAALSAGAHSIATQGENTNWKKSQRQKWNNHMRHLREDLDNALSALRFGVGVGPASSGAALKRSIQDQLGKKPLDFSSMLSAKQKMQPGFYMQPGLGDEHQSTEEAVLKVLGNLQHQCVQKVMQGEIRNPRVGKFLPDSHNDGKSRILFRENSWTSPTDKTDDHPKSCVVWIARVQTVKDAVKMLTAESPEEVLWGIGELRFVERAGPRAQMYTVQPAIEQLPLLIQIRDDDETKVETSTQRMDPDSSEDVAVWQLANMHKEYAVHSTLRRMIIAMQEGRGEWESTLRNFLGLASGSTPTDDRIPLISQLFGEPSSNERANAIGKTQAVPGAKMLSEAQRQCLMSLNNEIATVDMVPGAGKTMIIETLANMFTDLPPDCKARLVVTEQNQAMVLELLSRLQKRLPKGVAARLGYDAQSEKDGWEQLWHDQVKEGLKDKVFKEAHEVNSAHPSCTSSHHMMKVQIFACI